MRKFVLAAGAVSLLALSGCAYDDYYGDGYDGDGYYGGYYGYYGPGYYDPYYSGPDWYFDGTYYFYYDRHSHHWYRRDHDGDHDHRDRDGDRDWGRNHDWHRDRNAPWNRPGFNRPQTTQPQNDRRFEGQGGDYRGRNFNRRSSDSAGQVRAPRPLPPPPQSSQPQQPPPDNDTDDSRDRPHRRGNHDHW